MDNLYIGLMSGTSLDGIDAVLADCGNEQTRLVAGYSHSFPAALRQQLMDLTLSGPDEIERLAIAEPAFARESSEAVLQLISRAGIDCSQVRAIGSHGQTIRHRPEQGFTLQMGDPSLIAELTGITVVADFRRRDVAAGGQGAPLVPAFHQAAFASRDEDRVIVNIGGMANITLLSRHQPVTGWDTGPGNILLDNWFSRYHEGAFDQDGSWAGSVQADQDFIAHCLKDDFFSRTPPKSTGRERFNHHWLEQRLLAFPGITPAAVQASLCSLTADSIAQDILHYAPEAQAVYLCGGGAHNQTLRQAIADQLHDRSVQTTASLGVDPDWVEATAFAWLARQTLHGLPGNLPAVTGASGDRVLGAVYSA